MRYDQFRTGLSYQDIYRMLWSGSDDPSTWRHKSRGVILRFWGGLKQQLWQDMIDRGLDPESMPPPPPRPARKALRFRGLIETMLAEDPEITAVAMLPRVRQAGYDGSLMTLRRLSKMLRSRPPRRPRRPPKVANAIPARPLPALLSARAAARLLGVEEDRVLLDIARGRYGGAFRAGRGWKSWVLPLSDIIGPDPTQPAEAG